MSEMPPLASNAPSSGEALVIDATSAAETRTEPVIKTRAKIIAASLQPDISASGFQSDANPYNNEAVAYCGC